MLDDGQRIVQWGYAAATLTGFPESQALGRPCYEVFQGHDLFGGTACREGCPAFGALQRGRLTSQSHVQLKLRDAPGQRFVCKLAAMPHPPGGAFATLVERQEPSAADAPPAASANDIAQDLALLSTLTARPLAPERPEESTEGTLEWLRQATKAEVAELFLVEPEGGDLLLTALRGPFRTAFTQIWRFRPGEGYPGLVLSGQQPIVTENLREDPRYLRTRVKERGFQYYACVPVRSASGGVLGSLNVATRGAPLDSERTVRILTWASRPLATSLEMGLFQRRLAMDAATVGASGSSEGEFEGLLRAVLDQLIITGKATGGALFFYDRSAQALVKRVVEGEFSGVFCPDMIRGRAEACPALGRGQSITLYGPRARLPRPCQQVSLAGGLVYCLPLIADGEPLGVALIGYGHRPPSPPSRYLAMLQEAVRQSARLVAQAWRNVQAREETLALLAQWGGELRQRDAASVAPVEAPAQGGTSATTQADRPSLDVRCLGPFELYRHGALVPSQMFERKGALTVLKVLAIREGRPLHRDEMAELLWPEADPKAAANRIYGLVHALRRVLEPSREEDGGWRTVGSDGNRYYLNLDAPHRLDLRAFRDFVRTAQQWDRNGETMRALSSYEAAASLYRGDLLEEEPYAEWCWEQRESLREVYLDVLRRLGTLYLQQSRPEKGVEVYRRALKADSLRENLHQGLMRALWAAGRRDEALRQYKACSDLLVKELGVAPLPETQQLAEAIRKNPSP